MSSFYKTVNVSQIPNHIWLAFTQAVKKKNSKLSLSDIYRPLFIDAVIKFTNEVEEQNDEGK